MDIFFIISVLGPVLDNYFRILCVFSYLHFVIIVFLVYFLLSVLSCQYQCK